MPAIPSVGRDSMASLIEVNGETSSFELTDCTLHTRNDEFQGNLDLVMTCSQKLSGSLVARYLRLRLKHGGQTTVLEPTGSMVGESRLEVSFHWAEWGFEPIPEKVQVCWIEEQQEVIGSMPLKVIGREVTSGPDVQSQSSEESPNRRKKKKRRKSRSKRPSVVKLKWYNRSNWLGLGVALVWTFGVLNIGFGIGGFVFSTLGLLLGAVGGAAAYFFVTCVVNETEMRVNKEALLISHGPLWSLRKDKNVSLSEIYSVQIGETMQTVAAQTQTTYRIYIEMKDGTEEDVVSLSEADAASDMCSQLELLIGID